MIERDCITLDGNNYAIVEEIDLNNNHYVYLVNTDNSEDLLIQKEEPLKDQPNTYSYSSLTVDNELNLVLTEVNKKITNKYLKD